MGPLAGVLLCSSVHQAFDGPASLLFSCHAGMWGERGVKMAPPSMHDSAKSPCFHGCPAFPPQAFPTTVSSLTSPHSVSPQSTAALALGLLHNPSTPAPSHCTFLGTSVPVRGLYGCDKDCLILIPFRLPQISSFTLSFQCFSSDSDDCPDVGIGPLLQFPNPPRAGPVLLTLLFFPLVRLS